MDSAKIGTDGTGFLASLGFVSAHSGRVLQYLAPSPSSTCTNNRARRHEADQILKKGRCAVLQRRGRFSADGDSCHHLGGDNAQTGFSQTADDLPTSSWQRRRALMNGTGAF